MAILGYLILLAVGGLFIGALARLLLPGRDPMSLLETMLVGIAGSLIAGLIAYYAFERRHGAGLLLSLLCTVALVYAVRRFRQRDQPAGGPTGIGMASRRTEVHFLPGCLIYSLVASVVLTILLNLIVRAF